MYVSFTAELNHRAGSDETHLIQIRCTQDRKHKRINTGISVPKKYWDAGRHQVKKGHPLVQEYNRIINNWLNKLSKEYAALLESGDDILLDDIVSAVSKEKAVSFYKFAESTKLAEFKSKGKMGTYRRYEAVLNKLKVYAPNLTIRKVDYRFLKDYQAYLLEQLGNSKDTVSSNLSAIRSIINEAIASGVYDKQNPFGQIRLQYSDNTKAKLTADELRRFQSCQLPDIRSLNIARDFFMACFYANGCRAGDMTTMKRSYIQEGQLRYTQGKTGKKMQLQIGPELQAIFTKYVSDSRQCIFPLFEDKDLIDERTINSRITYLNKYIREVCKYAGIVKKISSHCSRHSFLDHALSASGGNIYEVKELAGHSSVKTTEIYLRQRVSNEQEQISADVFSKINSENI